MMMEKTMEKNEIITPEINIDLKSQVVTNAQIFNMVFGFNPVTNIQNLAETKENGISAKFWWWKIFDPNNENA